MLCVITGTDYWADRLARRSLTEFNEFVQTAVSVVLDLRFGRKTS